MLRQLSCRGCCSGQAAAIVARPAPGLAIQQAVTDSPWEQAALAAVLRQRAAGRPLIVFRSGSAGLPGSLLPPAAAKKCTAEAGVASTEVDGLQLECCCQLPPSGAADKSGVVTTVAACSSLQRGLQKIREHETAACELVRQRIGNISATRCV